MRGTHTAPSYSTHFKAVGPTVADSGNAAKNTAPNRVRATPSEFPIIFDALTIVDGAVQIDSGKCVGCYTCILSCPYGALSTSSEGAIQKCELCAKNAFGQPMCVQGCPNKAIVYEER